MKRRTLDVLFSVGGVVLAGLLVVAGLVLASNANFANTYVTDQLSQQNITFKTADTLTDEERQSSCLVQYAGQKLTTGKQAECYANNFIGLHVKSVANGQTYADLGGVQSQLRTQVTAANDAVTAATAAHDPTLPTLQKQATDLSTQLTNVTAQRETLFKGETLRGLLLTSYGFSEFGTKAGQASVVVYLAAALLALLSIFGFIHAWMTPKENLFAAPERTVAVDKPRVGV
jgi:hypothetical protein